MVQSRSERTGMGEDLQRLSRSRRFRARSWSWIEAIFEAVLGLLPYGAHG